MRIDTNIQSTLIAAIFTLAACGREEAPEDMSSPPTTEDMSGAGEMGTLPDLGMVDMETSPEDMFLSDANQDDDADMPRAIDQGGEGVVDMAAEEDMAAPSCTPLEPVVCQQQADCQASEQCIRGVCIETCGANLDVWDAAMPASLVPVVNVCASSSIMGVRGDADCRQRARVFSLTTSRQGSKIIYEVREGAIEEGPQNLMGTAETENGDDHFISFNAAPNPAGTRFAFGYTRSDVSGEVLVMSTDGSTMRIAAAGNYDLDWIDNDRLLVNGLSAGAAQVEGQGIYLIDLSGGQPETRRLTIGPGSASGAVANLRSRDEVLVGGSNGLDGVVYLVGTSELLAMSQSAPIDLATSSFTSFDTASDFEWIAESHLAGYDESYTKFQWVRLGADDLDEPEDFVDTGVFFEIVTIPGSPRFLLWHSDGYLMVEASAR